HACGVGDLRRDELRDEAESTRSARRNEAAREACVLAIHVVHTHESTPTNRPMTCSGVTLRGALYPRKFSDLFVSSCVRRQAPTGPFHTSPGYPSRRDLGAASRHARSQTTTCARGRPSKRVTASTVLKRKLTARRENRVRHRSCVMASAD